MENNITQDLETPQLTNLEPQPSVVPDETQTQNPQSLPPQKKRSLMLVIILILGLLILVGVGYLVYVQTQTPQNLVPEINTQSASTPSQPHFNDEISSGGIEVGVPPNWTVSISEQSNSALSARLYPSSGDVNTTYLEVQVEPVSSAITNPTLSFTSEVTNQDNYPYVIREGRETLLSSKRQVIQWQVNQGDTQLLLTLFGTSENIAQYRQTVQMILENALPPKSTSFLISQAQAQELETPLSSPNSQITTIAGFPVEQWQQIEVMEGPYPERFTSDLPYKDGYAKLYKFKVLAGQRIEFLAEESVDLLGAIATEYYDSSGNMILEAQTRGSLTERQPLTETGWIYALVRSEEQKQGPFLLRVFDLDQVEDLYYVQYAEGSQMLLNGPSQKQYLPQEAAIVVRFTAPIEIVGDDKIRYFREVGSGCIACTNQAWHGDVTPQMIVQVNQVKVPIKITKLFSNQALIQPADGSGFPINANVQFELDYGIDSNGFGSGYSGAFSTY